METKYLKTFNRTGMNEIHTDKVIEDWNHKWYISQWGDEFTLIKIKNKRIYALKTHISQKDAFEIIKACGLFEEKSRIFASGSIWRKKGMIDVWLDEHGDSTIEEKVKIQLFIADKINKLNVSPSELSYNLNITEYDALRIMRGQCDLTLDNLLRLKYKYKIDYEY